MSYIANFSPLELCSRWLLVTPRAVEPNRIIMSLTVSRLTAPLNHYLGRRGAIFVACLISSVSCVWQAFTYSWWQLLLARFFLGLGIGPKSATVPIYASECAPKNIRGGLVMMWQMWTAFGELKLV